MRYFLLIILLVLGIIPGLNGQVGDSRIMDVSQVARASPLSKKAGFSYLEPGANIQQIYTSVIFSTKPVHKGFLPPSHVGKQVVIQFTAANSADSVKTVWFFPGLYFSEITLFRDSAGALLPYPSVTPDSPDEISYLQIKVLPQDTMTFVATLKPVRTHLNRLRPVLIGNDYLKSFVTDMDARNMQSKIITYVFCGLLLMMVLFSLASYFQGGNSEFLYYSGYAFLLGMMLFMKAVFSFHTSWFSFFQEGYLDFIMQSVGILLYMLFMQKYLSTKQYHPFLHRLYNWGIALLVISMVSFTFVHYFTDNYVLENSIENITKILLLILVIIFLVYSVRYWKDKLLRYLFWGNLCLLVFSLISLLLLTGNMVPPRLPEVFRSALFYYEMGLFFELVFFFVGLNHKNKLQLISQARERERLKADNQLKEYEKEIAVYKAQQQERERISADMHDELGSGMTAIRLMSEIARNKMKENTPVEIDKISHSADEVLNKMNAIIWSMNSGNDTIDNLVSYIRSYAIEYFEMTPINCRINTPDRIEPRELTGDKRRNLFLCVKETLNNTLKHSRATEVRIYFVIDKDLQITIHDNGVGIDMLRIRQFGNGLKNIAKRMENIGGSYRVERMDGTVTTILLPL